MQLADEEERHRARISLADDACFHGPAEVFGNDPHRSPRRRLLGGRVERHDQRGLPRTHVHLHGDGGRDHRLQERHDLLGEAAQHESRIFRGIDVKQLFQCGGESQLA